MIDCADYFNALIRNHITFFSGVPDSLLKDFCGYITDHAEPNSHVIAANEGNAIALASGHYLATGDPGLVYMQNSGLGNAVNPITSLIDPDVYNIPVLLLIGWRGEPGKKDEPQHEKQGKITLPLLETLGIDFCILPDTLDEAIDCLNTAVCIMQSNLRSHAIIIRKGTFAPYKLLSQAAVSYEINRESAIKLMADCLNPRDIFISTTGMSSRELFEHRATSGEESSGQDFLTVGSMGHASQIALGIALAQPDRQVFCLDGDGALIMHMGSLAITGSHHPSNFKHIVINNGAHDSVGGQPTVGFNMDIPAIAAACGYHKTMRVEFADELKQNFDILRNSQGPALLEIRVGKGARSDLGRPTTTPNENKENFMRFLQK